MLYVVNYADGQPFEKYRKFCTKSAYWFGHADEVIEYTKKDIPQSYIDSHKNIFAYKRGAGLWLWKSYIVNKTLLSMKDGDWMFYTDGGSIFIRNIHKLIKCAKINNTDIMLFEQPLLHRQFTKKETMMIMNVEDRNENQTLGIFLLQKTPHTIALMQEWLSCCEQEELISPKHFHDEVSEYDDFVTHREDQSILSALRLKYSITPFRDPSDYGEFPYMYASAQWKYCPKQYDNSFYKTTVLCNRKRNPFVYLLSYYIKHILNKLGIYYTEEIFLDKLGVKKHNTNENSNF